MANIYFLPHNEIVARAWLRQIPELPNNQIGSVLPGDNSTWAPSGFVQVSVVGGSPRPYVPIKSPVFQVDCWAVLPGSTRPPWHQANQLAEIILDACYGSTDAERPVQRKVVTPPSYYDARVLDVTAMQEPRRMQNDDARYARYTFEMQIDWVTNKDVKEVSLMGDRFLYKQLTPASVWSVAHELGAWPQVAVKIEDTDETAGADIFHIDDNNLTISFSEPVAGEAVMD